MLALWKFEHIISRALRQELCSSCGVLKTEFCAVVKY